MDMQAQRVSWGMAQSTDWMGSEEGAFSDPQTHRKASDPHVLVTLVAAITGESGVSQGPRRQF